MNGKRRPEREARISRARFLGLAGLGLGGIALGGCGSLLPGNRELPRIPGANSGDAPSGAVKEFEIFSEPLEFEVGGRRVSTWGYNGRVPGPEIRVTEGDRLRMRVRNRLPESTTVHPHGLPVENAMDGVPHLTQPPIPPGGDFLYEFTVPTSGTYLYHSHAGLQLDRGLYGPLIVEPKREPLDYDREYVILLDDWLDGVNGTPEDAFREMNTEAGPPGGMMGGGMMGDSSMVEYPFYLINGRPPEDPETFEVRRGERVRLRISNPASDTLFRFAVGGHRLTVTHADGQPVEPVEVDALRIGSGERYDVLLEAGEPGVWQVAAAPEGRSGLARALLRYRESAATSPPPPNSRPEELNGELLLYGDLHNLREETFPQDGPLAGGPDRTLDLTLARQMGGMGGMGRRPGRGWTINGQTYPDAEPLEVEKGEWVRVELTNHSPVPHPMHLHGHFFQVRTEGGGGPFKDTLLVEGHMGRAAFDFVADNPGKWFFHCHLTYHMESGMARVVRYRDGGLDRGA
ncbi:Putative multicopper oxidase (plasmid) [Rubrobacter radiotolerans]|uniref:Multicopper oxidase family protein n=1 Tax=Rubrobacter radiotolerans TaxID=42256 RepID=A0A023X7Q5_RUBRA|nr:multicopper oxidase family protein [Rubrobacter radiotolerans]AHY48373.1 Putative multicopper oxidase [Rubrobacter radiotolerans]MDX5895509.1 multicopper oxidase family protein [Rubrobacter radiotolerans]SMC01575.1 Multicopper oxidase with three cupredoxin domains (includes cell division protein FtsP and spore coat protein CotA) [Rubrobacter radiotolerans DSM 5868]